MYDVATARASPATAAQSECITRLRDRNGQHSGLPTLNFHQTAVFVSRKSTIASKFVALRPNSQMACTLRGRRQAGANRQSVPDPPSRSLLDGQSMRTGKSMSVTTPNFMSRRRLLQGTAGLAAIGLSGQEALAAKELVVGFIYVGPKDDYGYNQAHAEAAAMLKKLPGVKIVEEEKVPDTEDVSKTMESMIQLDGGTLLFPTSFGFFVPDW